MELVGSSSGRILQKIPELVSTKMKAKAMALLNLLVIAIQVWSGVRRWYSRNQRWKTLKVSQAWCPTADIIYQSLGIHVLGWFGRLVFPPPRSLKDHPPKPFFCGPCGVFPSFDPILVPEDRKVLNVERDKLSSPTPGADHQLWNGVLWKPSGLKRSFATIQSDILISSVSKSLECTATPIQSLEQAAVQFQKRLEQAALPFQNEFVTIQFQDTLLLQIQVSAIDHFRKRLHV